MVDQLTLQTVGILLTAITVSIAAIYYTLTLRYTRRNQDLQLGTRQAQLFAQFVLFGLSSGWLDEYIELLNMEWEDYDDFEKKYGSDNNPRSFAMRHRAWFHYTIMGKFLKEGLLDIDLVYSLLTDTAVWQWYKWRDVIEEQRRRYHTPDFVSDWEYLVAEVLKYKEKLGYSWEPPETFGRYIPDQ
jgi:hypothetical protein